MATADVKYGVLRAPGANDQDTYDADAWSVSGLGRFGGNLLVGGMPSKESPFVVGGLLHGGAFFAPGGLIPDLGVAVMMGPIIGPSQAPRFGFFLIGVGAEILPGPIFSAHMKAGASLDGLVLAAALDVGLREGASYYLLGVELGWGRLL
jgi:hypothetical protein